MYRAGASNNSKPSDPYKAPRLVPTPITLPREGGGSQFDRVHSSPGRQYGKYNGRDGYSNNGGGHRRGGGNGNRSSSPRKNSQSQSRPYSSSSSQSSYRPRHDNHNYGVRENWNDRGSEGFASATAAAYNEATFDSLDQQPRANFQKVSGFGADEKEIEAKLASSGRDWAKLQKAEQEKKRKEAEEAAERRKLEEERIKENDLRNLKRGVEEERERKEEKKRLLNSSSSSTKLASTSTTTSSTTANRKVTDTYSHLTHLSESARTVSTDKAKKLVAELEEREKEKREKQKKEKEIVLSDDEEEDSFDLKVQTLPVKGKKDKGKGKEKERERSKGEEAESEKKSSKLSRFKRSEPESSPPKKTKAGNTIISSSSSLTKQKAPKSNSARQGSLTLEEQFAQEQEDAEMDAEIARADEKAKREKEKSSKKMRKSENDDSDIEVMDTTGEAEGTKGKEKDRVDVLAHLAEFRKKKLAAMPQREKTPDELLDSQHEEIDPSTLCPFCDSLLPTHPSARLTSLKDYLLSRPHIEPRTSMRNRKAKYLPIVQIASFCQLHKVETTLIPEGKKKGYPMTIDWDSLPGRIETAIAPRLSEVILGNTFSSFSDRAKRDWEKNGGFKRTGVTAEWDSFHFEEPGYYGPRGFELIHSTLRQLFTVDQPLLTSSNIGELSSDFYLRRVLVPETALELIRLDYKLDRSPESIAKATKVLEESRAFGKAAHGIVEDLKKEHARAKEEERLKQERKEQDRIDKIKREKEELEAEERRELEEEEARLAAEVAAAPQYRKPKALAQVSQPKSSNPSTSAPASSASNGSSSSTKKRPRSPDLNDLAALDESPAVKPKSKSKTQTTLGGGGSIISQPSVLAFLNRTGVAKEDLGKDSKKPTPSSSSSATSTTKEKSKKAEGKQSIVLDSSDSSDSDDLQITSSDKGKKKKLKRRASSPEKRKRSPSPDKLRGKEKEKKRRASSPTGSPKKKKSKSTSSTAPITDQTNSLSLLRQALASSDLEEEIETNFKEKNLKAKKDATREKKSKAAKKAFQKKKNEDSEKVDKYKGDADSSDSD